MYRNHYCYTPFLIIPLFLTNGYTINFMLGVSIAEGPRSIALSTKTSFRYYQKFAKITFI